MLCEINKLTVNYINKSTVVLRNELFDILTNGVLHEWMNECLTTAQLKI